jgi:hypothetical protein
MAVTSHIQMISTKGQAGDKLRLRTFIEVQLIGEDKKPIPGEAYAITLPGGKVMAGMLDSDGLVRLEGIPAGVCMVSFPDLDKGAWVPVETETSSEPTSTSEAA